MIWKNIGHPVDDAAILAVFAWNPTGDESWLVISDISDDTNESELFIPTKLIA